MKIYPKTYKKNELLIFLKKINANEKIIKNLSNLPENIKYKGNNYYLYINVNWYNVDKTYYGFEFNYYSDELMEYLFNYKIFNDIELSITYIECLLIKHKIISSDENCEEF